MSITRRRRRAPARKGRGRRWLRYVLPPVAALLLAGTLASLWYADRLSTVFEAREREVASRLLGRPYPLSVGTLGSPQDLATRLERLGYRRVSGSPAGTGTFSVRGDTVRAGLRAFRHGDTSHPERDVRVRFGGGRIESVDPRGAFLEPEVLRLFYGPEVEERELVEVSECPKHLIDAIVAAEDRRFFTHPGVDPLGILRAMRANASSGSLSQGGSTLTQQLAKNLYFTGERTFVRKAKEAFAAVVLEASYSKERLLRAYLNEIYLGQRGPASIRGVGQASRHWFGKSVSDLTLEESALIAGMIQTPGRYNPNTHPREAIARRDLVLDGMVEIGAITPEQRRSAAAEPLRVVAERSESLSAHAGYVADSVRRELIDGFGASFWQRGLAVHASIDPLYQEAAEAAVRKGLERLAKEWRQARKGRDGGELQAALVTLDLHDGSILALVGGRDFGGSQFNRVTSAHRQPGSLFKPVVYLAGLTHPGNQQEEPGWIERFRRRWSNDDDIVELAPGARDGDVVPASKEKKRRWWQRRDRQPEEDLEEEELEGEEELEASPESLMPPVLPLHAGTVLYDEPYEVVSGGKLWSPMNSDLTFRGPVTVQRALEESLNVPTARLAAAVGFDRVARTARALGIRSAMPEVPSIALGSAEVTPLEMAAAFATIATGGRRTEPYMILRIEDGEGHARSLRAGWPFPADPLPASVPASGAPGDGRERRPAEDVDARLPSAGARLASVIELPPAGPSPSLASAGPAARGGAPAGEELVTEQAAWLMTALLQGVMDHGTGRSAATLGFHGVAAGKTGTSDEGRDLWFCGFTPDLLTLVWVGFDDGTPTRLSGARGALPIWVDIMQRVGAETSRPFEGDGHLLWAPIDPATGQLARRSCPETRWAPFIPGTEPVLRCKAHGSFWDRFRE